MKREDFTISANKGGYMISYKGYKIGGASILGNGSHIRGKAAERQIKDYVESAERDINYLINGYGSQHYIAAIKEINPEAFTTQNQTQ